MRYIIALSVLAIFLNAFCCQQEAGLATSTTGNTEEVSPKESANSNGNKLNSNANVYIPKRIIDLDTNLRSFVELHSKNKNQEVLGALVLSFSQRLLSLDPNLYSLCIAFCTKDDVLAGFKKVGTDRRKELKGNAETLKAFELKTQMTIGDDFSLWVVGFE